ncbi:site-specific recombinase, phage integrase family [Gardnerella vaginalis 409-05]|uniref:Resolvase/invertase-type recombinase catalytic domain-containing protein n=2 Tax=Gardnerella swidsinskii TaxID=2792979 RepID=A0ABM6GIM2_9BIFI|nr:site-specific recombinase, phage integrase family [Gardnerella vaginalis 409-05]APW18575.1 hypothetical protein BVL65_03075 [Gardnerella vaginalis]MCT7893630.1 recombinase family protein [Lactobacillus iners]
MKVGSSRSEFNRMIDECEKGNLDIILTKSVSRFGRDTKEGLEAIRKIRSCGTRIIFETDKIDTETVDDELLISVVQACCQAENDWRSENIVWGLRRRAEDGTSGLYSRACYGYKKDKHGMLNAGIISKEKFEAVELEMAVRSNVEVGEDGTVKRKSKKYSSKR